MKHSYLYVYVFMFMRIIKNLEWFRGLTSRTKDCKQTRERQNVLPKLSRTDLAFIMEVHLVVSYSLARQLALRVKRGSGTLSRWHNQTEKNISSSEFT